MVDKLRILFVDDDPFVLGGIRDSLRRRRQVWEMRFTDSPRRAVEALAHERYDVVISDMRMPEMNGSQFLEHVRSTHPETVRIVLSGHMEADAAMRALPVAHQFITKPCSPEILEAVISRTWHLLKTIPHEGLRRNLGRVERLPPAPSLYAELRQTLHDPRSGAKTISSILSRDAAMSAKLLQLVNSGFLRAARKIVSIEQAVVYLGFGTLASLVLSMELFGATQAKCGTDVVWLEKIQVHSHLVACLARAIFEDRSLAEEAFVIGLLHEIGSLTMSCEMDEEYRHVQRVAADSRRAIGSTEEEAFGVSHAEVGAYLLGLWGLPWPIVDGVARHRDGPGAFREPDGTMNPEPACAVALADLFVQLAEMGQGGTGEDEEQRAGLERDVVEMAAAFGGSERLDRLGAELHALRSPGGA